VYEVSTVFGIYLFYYYANLVFGN